MYHYRESGLPHVFLKNGYREIKTANGLCIAIDNVEGLHRAICKALVNERSFMNGPEVRFIRKYLDLSQSQMASYLGVDEQTVRRWEKLSRVPKQGDLAVRLMFRDLTREHTAQKSLPELVKRIEQAAPIQDIAFIYKGAAKTPWQTTLVAA